LNKYKFYIRDLTYQKNTSLIFNKMFDEMSIEMLMNRLDF